MKFMFKMIIWGFVALMILPSIAPFDTKQTKVLLSNNDENTQITSNDAMRLAVNVASDIQGLCARSPEICQTSGKILTTAVERAQNGALIVAKMVEKHRTEKKIELDSIETGSLK